MTEEKRYSRQEGNVETVVQLMLLPTALNKQLYVDVIRSDARMLNEAGVEKEQIEEFIQGELWRYDYDHRKEVIY